MATIAIEVTTDDEAGKVFGTLRTLERDRTVKKSQFHDEGYFLAWGIEDYDVERVVGVFEDMRAEFPGIHAYQD